MILDLTGLNRSVDEICEELIRARVQREELLEACKELSEALASVMRVLTIAAERHPDIIVDFVAEMDRSGIAEGVGGRAGAAIRKAETIQ